MRAQVDGLGPDRAAPAFGTARLPSLWHDAWRGDPALMRFALFGLLLLLPMAFGLALDDRVLRGVSVWLKPMKFALSLAVLAWTSAYFAAMVDIGGRWGLRAIRWIIIGAASFEMIYIIVQAGLGEGSHYNVGDPFHAAMYGLMGVGAVMLTASQGWLAWLVLRHARPGHDPAYRLSVVLGLSLAFVLGTLAGVPLSSLKPPDASLLPVFGWHWLSDLRPAHFVGLHAEQVLPLIGAWALALHPNRARQVVLGATAAWVLLFVGLFAAGLQGARLAPGF